MTDSNYERAGRSATFTKTIETEADLSGLVDRIVQPVGFGERRNELDAVSITVIEQTPEGETGYRSSFRSLIDSQDDLEAVAERILNTVAMGFNRGEIGEIKVQVVELVEEPQNES